MQEALGYVAATLTTASFLPQVVKVWRTHSVQDISLWMYSLFTFGVALWFLYGLAIGSLPVMAANGITLLLAASILVAKVRYHR